MKTWDDNAVNQLLENRLNDIILSNSFVEKDKKLMISPAEWVGLFGRVQGVLVVYKSNMVSFYPYANNYSRQREYSFHFNEIKSVIRYFYMYKHTALEIFLFSQEESVLFNFRSTKSREQFLDLILHASSKIEDLNLKTPEMTQLWARNQLSNYDYLLFLNTITNRSFNDISRYPIFPWIITDFTSTTLDLSDSSIYRDLSLPLGAINKNQLEVALQKYSLMKKGKNQRSSAGNKPFLYNTFVSTPGGIVFYLTRKVPELFLKLQNGAFGPTDRVFKSVEGHWYTMMGSGADLMEMIPEFYDGKADFLVNFFKLDFGVDSDGNAIDDVELPSWASSISDFAVKMRSALESDHVSRKLHQWIDLVFGCNQRDVAAVKSYNIYHPYCYDENIKWEEYKSPIHAEAMKTLITEYGQVPLQMMTKPHPKKKIPLAKSQTPKSPNGNYNTEVLLKEIERLRFENERLTQMHLPTGEEMGNSELDDEDEESKQSEN